MSHLLKNNPQEILDKKKQLMILSIFPIVLILLGLFVDDFPTILSGLWRIVKKPDVLLTDYLAIGGIGATFINVGILSLANIYILYRLRILINGPLTAAIFTIIGFSFFGKNIYNVWPIYLGGLLFVYYQKMRFKDVVVIIMFGTSLAPIVSMISFGLHIPSILAIPLGIFTGIMIGFVLPPLSSHMLRFHDGYNLYNIGFTAGLLGSLLTALFRGFGYEIETQYVLSTEYSLFLQVLLIGFFLLLIVIGFFLNQKSFTGYSKIFHFSGRLVTDFIQHLGSGIAYINMGIMGLISILFVISLGSVFNGPVVGGIMTVVGFSSFGKHPRNSLPIMPGVFLGGLVKTWQLSATEVVIAGLFGTTLSPIAGSFGIAIGMLTGFLHVSLVMNVGVLHGGINLYNNGFAGGMLAAMIVPLVEAFKRGDAKS